jgi:hypothetical protein
MDTDSIDATPLSCPHCKGAMVSLRLDGHYGRPVTLDHCEACKLFWFDALETAALSKTGLQTVFALIGQGPVSDLTVAPSARCPRCTSTLKSSFDLTRFGKTHNYRCPQNHGHAVTHLQFLAEKGLLRKPTPADFQAPQSQLLNTPCPSCGAALHALDDGKCAFCGSPVVVLDLQKALQALEVAGAQMASGGLAQP